MVTDTEGIKYDVTEIKEDGKEVSVIRKNGVILEEQIVNQDKVNKFKLFLKRGHLMFMTTMRVCVHRTPCANRSKLYVQ